VLQLPAASGTIARTEDFAAPPAIGSTTPNSAAFTTLTANNGTLTASAPVLDLAQTWNNAAVAFTSIRLDITNTDSFAGASGGSKFFEVNIDGTPQVRFTRVFSTPVLFLGPFDSGIGTASSNLNVYIGGTTSAVFPSGSSTSGLQIRSDGKFSWSGTTNPGNASDLELRRDERQHPRPTQHHQPPNIPHIQHLHQHDKL
jgi:hypothetical protein